ncbi:MAG: phenylacetate-CoA oxygenase subunit PaaJ [Firmicutes bacterium]|nr:phenylacetate-CoA oxygenase subunit PaaJ [Bacillota bacterium]
MVSKQEILTKLEQVMDPEIPGLNIVDMGMVSHIRIGETVEVDLLPTFLGCPALDVIRRRVEETLHEYQPVVRFTYDIPWSSDRISPEGRARLLHWGVAPPASAEAQDPACPLCGSSNTEKQSRFGPTLCRALYYCRDCQQPFEAIKVI